MTKTSHHHKTWLLQNLPHHGRALCHRDMVFFVTAGCVVAGALLAPQGISPGHGYALEAILGMWGACLVSRGIILGLSYKNQKKEML